MKVRLGQILKEKEENPKLYQRDGYLYFEEFLPFIEEQLHAAHKAAQSKAVPVAKQPERVQDVQAKRTDKPRASSKVAKKSGKQSKPANVRVRRSR